MIKFMIQGITDPDSCATIAELLPEGCGLISVSTDEEMLVRYTVYSKDQDGKVITDAGTELPESFHVINVFDSIEQQMKDIVSAVAQAEKELKASPRPDCFGDYMKELDSRPTSLCSSDCEARFDCYAEKHKDEQH